MDHLICRAKKRTKSAWVIWLVGLPECGKSSLARAAVSALHGYGELVTHLQMDDRRKIYFPSPEYTSKQRIKAYELFAAEAALLASQGQNVLMDASAPKLKMRELARALTPKFAEIYLDCSLETAMQREGSRPEGKVMADMYKKALERKQSNKVFPGLGEVIGVDTEFEQNPLAECVLDVNNNDLKQSCSLLLQFINFWK